MDGVYVHLTGLFALRLFPCSLAAQSPSINNARLESSLKMATKATRPVLRCTSTPSIHHAMYIYYRPGRLDSLEAVYLFPCLAMHYNACNEVLESSDADSRVQATRAVISASTTFYVRCPLRGGCVENASCNP